MDSDDIAPVQGADAGVTQPSQLLLHAFGRTRRFQAVDAFSGVISVLAARIDPVASSRPAVAEPDAGFLVGGAPALRTTRVAGEAAKVLAEVLGPARVDREGGGR